MIYNNSIPAYIITLKERKSRKIACEKMLKRMKLEANFYIQNLDTNTVQGNKESHVSLLKKCKSDGLKSVLVLEDDIKIVGSLRDLPPVPDKWDILYLGGEVLRKFGDKNAPWVRCISKRHHAYIVNLENDILLGEIEKCLCKKGKKYCDWISERIQPIFSTYMINPIRVIQQDGPSDITGKYEFYTNMADSMNGFFIPQHTIKNDLYNLKLPETEDTDLPNISVITVVNNCRDIFSLTLRNFEESFYPKDKLEWVILEVESDTNVRDMISDVKNLKYVSVKNELDHEGLLDLAVSHCSNDIILNMDVYGFYSRENMLSRVKLLEKYPFMSGVGSNKLGIYDIIHKKSFMGTEWKDKLENSSLAFRKSDWKFSDGNFFENKLDRFINIPHTFIQYRIILGKDETKNTVGQQIFNYYDTWDIIDQEFMDNLGGYVKRKTRFNEINRMEIN